MRVIYRGDLDGCVCAAILSEVDLCDEVRQAHPKDMQEGKVAVTKDEIICNLPYHPDCAMWFDHHSSEINADSMPQDYKGRVAVAPSAARLVYEYFLPEHPELARFSRLVDDTDRVDSANLTLEQVQHPKGAILLGLLLDPRTGLGLYHDYRISNFQWVSSIYRLLTQHTVDEILAMEDSQERIKRYQSMQEEATAFYLQHSRLEGNVIVSDVRGMAVPAANRFLVYTLPGLLQGNISLRIADGKQGAFDTISVAHSIFNRTSKVDAGALCKGYEGGGHRGAATCQINLEDSDRVLQELIEACRD